MGTEKNINRKVNLSDNRGVAMVSVMIVLTVCMLIATIVLQITYTSLLSRRVNSQANSNFYAAESAIDDIQTVLQSIAVYSAQNIQNNQFIATATQTLLSASGASSLSDTEIISQYIFDNLSYDLKPYFWKEDDHTQVDTNKLQISTVTVNDTSSEMIVSISLSYENEKGYLTNISTDLVLNDIVESMDATDYPIGSYSLITGGGVAFQGGLSKKGVCMDSITQEGNCYVGTQKNSTLAMELKDYVLIEFNGNLIVNGDVTIESGSSLWLTGDQVEIRGNIYIDSLSSLVIGNSTTVTCRDIILQNGDEEWSVKDETKPSYVNYDGSTVYAKAFPYDADRIANGDNDNGIRVNNAYGQGNIGGMILYQANDGKTHVLEHSGFDASGLDKWTMCGDGGGVLGCSINLRSNIKTEAKTTFWGLNGEQITVDPAFATFVNAPVVYYQSYPRQNMQIGTQQAKICIDKSSVGDKVKVPININSDGATVDAFVYVDSAGNNVKGNQLTEMGTNPTFDAISFNGVSFTGFQLGTGYITNIINCNTGKILFYVSWEDYQVSFNGETYLGILMSADKCNYSLKDGKYSRGYSILQGYEAQTTESGEDAFDNMLNTLGACHMLQGNVSSANLNDYEYSLYLYDNMFSGGLNSFVAGGAPEGGDGPGVIFSDGLYDFITMENWQAY